LKQYCDYDKFMQHYCKLLMLATVIRAIFSTAINQIKAFRLYFVHFNFIFGVLVPMLLSVLIRAITFSINADSKLTCE